MSQELVKFEGKQPIVMKGGLTHWVTPETAERFQNQLQNQTSHTFVRLKEANITINTAEVEGVYTMAQYDDICKVKQGMWQCQYQSWHNKGKKECECAKEAFAKARKARDDAEKKERERPLTPEEQATNLKKVREMGEEMSRKFGWNRPGPVSTTNNRTCIMCPTKLTGKLRYYCSGVCVNKARERGIYGQEEQHKERTEALATLE